MRTLQDLFLDELADIYDAERRTAKAMPRIAKAATCDALKDALHSHLEETEGHMEDIEEIFGCFDAKVRARPCGVTVGLLEEGDELIEDYKDSPAINAALIFLAQKIEHHEIAQYGCLHAWALVLGNKEAAGLLQEILDEEKAANDALTELARGGSNEEALGEGGKKPAVKAPAKKPAGKKSALPPLALAPDGTRRKTAPTLLA
jgi:ferritin-like metal-binding protein YciE